MQLVAGQNTVIDSDNTYQLQLHIGQWEWGVILSKKGASPVLFDSEQGLSVQGSKLLLNLHDIEQDIEKITVYIARGRASHDAGNQLSAQLNDLLGQQCYAKIDISGQIADQTALAVLEIYKHQQRWKIRCVLQGYSAGLVKLLDTYDIKAPVSKPTAPHREVSQQVNVNKQSSTMANTNKHSSNDHAVGVQLRWQFAGGEKKTIANYFLGEKFKPISDLRIGCFYQLKNSQNGIVYSFDDEFKGSFDGVPYVAANRLTQEHLENLDFNDRYLHKLHKCLVFVSMMEAYDSWDGLDVEVKFQIPGVERTIISPSTLMVKPIYAVAMLDFSGEQPTITPLNEYFNDLVELDSAFGWGLPFRRNDDCETNSDNDED